jgi:Tfp pilus assembly protein PilO
MDPSNGNPAIRYVVLFALWFVLLRYWLPWMFYLREKEEQRQRKQQQRKQQQRQQRQQRQRQRQQRQQLVVNCQCDRCLTAAE